MVFRKRCKILLVILLSIAMIPVRAETVSQPPHVPTFLSVTDIHFDPFAGCEEAKNPCLMLKKLRESDHHQWATIFEKYGPKTTVTTGHDSNYPLFKASIIELKKVNKQEHPNFVVLLGDFLAHEFRDKYERYSGDMTKAGYQRFVKKTLQYLTLEFSRAFPTIDIYPVIGNNDTYTGDYTNIPHGQFFRDTETTWSVLIKNEKNKENFQSTFPTAGYYVVTLPGGHGQLIVLNTVLFSSHVPREVEQKPAQAELEWLEQQLKRAATKHQPVILAYHIPAGIDVLATIGKPFSSIQDFWHSYFKKKFKNILKRSATPIVGIYAGHIHIDTYQMVTLKKMGEVPVHFTPAISPIFGNDPGFKIFHYDADTLALKESDTYRFSSNYGYGAQAEWRKS